MRRAYVAVMFVLLVLGAGSAEAIELQTTTFPEGRTVGLFMGALPGAAKGRINAQVTYRDGQAKIEAGYEDLKPAILYAGDVTCYVLWAVSRDGEAENLGEFLVDEPKGQLEFTTGKKAFALIVTAEPFYLVSQPSSPGDLHQCRVQGQEGAFHRFRIQPVRPLSQSGDGQHHEYCVGFHHTAAAAAGAQGVRAGDE